MNVDEVKRAMRKKPKTVDGKARNVSTGASMLNLGISGNVDVGITEGQCVLFVGDTSAGKTWIGMSLLAEASINPEFDGYRLIYDAPERGARMDKEFYFGERMVERLETCYSDTVEDFFYSVDDDLKDGTPFIRLLDSVDALDTLADIKKFKQQKSARKKEEVAKGSMGMSKPKILSENMRRMTGSLSKSRSILVIINQTRDNVDAGMFEQKKTRSGGWALEFYSDVVMWSSVAGHIKKQVRGKDRELGSTIKVRIQRTRATGKQRIVYIPILHSVGIDDIGSCIDYLVDEGVWKGKAGKEKVSARKGSAPKTSGILVAKGIGPEIVGSREDLIREIEERGLQDDLRMLVQETWDEVEEACRVERKNRYR